MRHAAAGRPADGAARPAGHARQLQAVQRPPAAGAGTSFLLVYQEPQLMLPTFAALGEAARLEFSAPAAASTLPRPSAATARFPQFRQFASALSPLLTLKPPTLRGMRPISAGRTLTQRSTPAPFAFASKHSEH